MVKHWNPPSAPPPAARYSQCSVTTGPGRWLSIAGQVGMHPDGSLAEGIDAQCQQALENLVSVLEANDMSAADLVRLTVYLTRRDQLNAYRAARGRILGDDCLPPSTLVVVAGLASPEWLVEIEAQAFQQV